MSETVTINGRSTLNMIHGDCLEVMPTLASGSIDMILTDPPYGTTACKWDSVIPFEPMWEQLKRVIKPNGAIVLFGSEPFSSALRMSNIKNYKYDWKWKKSRPCGPLNAKIMPLKDIEDLVVFYSKQPPYNPIMWKGSQSHATRPHISKGSVSITGDFFNKGNVSSTKYPRQLLEFKSLNGVTQSHPTQKPVKLMEYLIKTYTNAGETVLDFTMGSGTTGVACVNLKRDFIGIEMDDKYFDIASERVKRHTAQGQLF